MAARVRAMVLTKPKTLMLAGHVKGVNPVHLAIVPGVPRVTG